MGCLGIFVNCSIHALRKYVHVLLHESAQHNRRYRLPFRFQLEYRRGAKDLINGVACFREAPHSTNARFHLSFPLGMHHLNHSRQTPFVPAFWQSSAADPPSVLPVILHKEIGDSPNHHDAFYARQCCAVPNAPFWLRLPHCTRSYPQERLAHHKPCECLHRYDIEFAWILPVR